MSPGRWAAQAGARSSLGQSCGGACLELRMGHRTRKGSPSPLPGDTPSLRVLTPRAQHHGECGGGQPWLSFPGLSHGHTAGMCWAHQGLNSPGAGHSDRGTRTFGIVLSGQHQGAWLGTPLRTEPSLRELGSPLTGEPRAPLSGTPPTSCPAGPCTGTEAPLGGSQWGWDGFLAHLPFLSTRPQDLPLVLLRAIRCSQHQAAALALESG